MNSYSFSKYHRHSLGFTLIEVLVSVLILAIGLLGLAGLQARGMKENHNAYLRAQATLMAQDMADRMRANAAGVVAGNYNSPTSTEVAACLTSSGCTSAQMATNDFYEWTNKATGRMSVADLPNGKGAVCIDSTPNDGTFASQACDGTGNAYVVKIWWEERENDTANNKSTITKRFVTSFRP
jgi:type IV pilus assembly protein PilV